MRVKGHSKVELEDVSSFVFRENMAERDNRVHASGQRPERLHLFVVFDLNGSVDLVLPAWEVDPDPDNHLVLPVILINKPVLRNRLLKERLFYLGQVKISEPVVLHDFSLLIQILPIKFL